MKSCLWLPLACLIGYLAGSWGSLDELRAFKEHSQDAKAKAAAKPAGFDTFARMVKIPETARHHRRARRDREKPVVSTISPPAATNAAFAKAPPGRKDPQEASSAMKSGQSGASATDAAPSRLSPEDLRARIEEARDLWSTRVDVACAQWKAKLRLDAEGEKAFDAALQEMNERLYDSVSALAAMLEDKPAMPPELGLRLVGDTAAILAETYDKIGACASPDMRDDISGMQMVDFIDPGVAEPLIGVQGKLDGFASGGRGKGNR